jgi:DNA-binding MarR family transcriptional regulator
MTFAEELSDHIETLMYHMKNSDKQSCEFVNLPELQVLGFLGKSGEPARMTDTAEHLELGLSNLTAIIDRLVAKELVARERSDEDRRVVRISLTSEGKEIVAKNRFQKHGLARQMLDALSEGDQKKLMILMRKIVGNMKGATRGT